MRDSITMLELVPSGEDTPITEAGMLAAFFGSFGMVHAELRTLLQGASVAAQVHRSFRPFHDLLDPQSANPR